MSRRRKWPTFIVLGLFIAAAGNALTYLVGESGNTANSWFTGMLSTGGYVVLTMAAATLASVPISVPVSSKLLALFYRGFLLLSVGIAMFAAVYLWSGVELVRSIMHLSTWSRSLYSGVIGEFLISGGLAAAAAGLLGISLTVRRKEQMINPGSSDSQERSIPAVEA